jgi:hypothetical protein
MRAGHKYRTARAKDLWTRMLRQESWKGKPETVRMVQAGQEREDRMART